MSAPQQSLVQLARERVGTSEKSESPRKTDVEASAIQVDTQDVFNEGDSGVDPVYQAKARLLNDAIQEVGMGKYQVRLCVFVDQGRNHSHDAFPRSAADLCSGSCSSLPASGGSRQYTFIFRPCVRVLKRVYLF